MKRSLILLLIVAGLIRVNAAPAASPLPPLVTSWLAAQTNLHTWSADFVQTRRLKSLTEPLTARGHVWFAAPNRFRWELGQPPQTIAVRTANDLLILYPHLKRVERYPLTGAQTGPWRDALAMLDAGFPRSQKALEDQYRVLSDTVTNQVCQLALEPRSSGARRMMPRLEIDFDTNDFGLRGTQLQFSDGSTLRNDFTNIVLNPRLDMKLFSPPIPKDYEVVEPLANH